MTIKQLIFTTVALGFCIFNLSCGEQNLGRQIILSVPATPGAPTLPAQTSWYVPPIVLNQGSNQIFDLSQTLPTCLQSGGVFSVDSSGSPLPAGVTLTPNGILSAAGAASPSQTTGVVFACTY